jgi:hypothetical protein
MSRLRDLPSEALQELIGNMCYSFVTLAINGASAATFRTTGTTTYSVAGIMKTKAALSAQAFSTGHAGLKIGETGYYVVALDINGNVSTTEGVGAFPDDIGNGKTAIGYIKVVADSAAFVPGTTALDNAGLTVTYTNLSLFP